MSKKSSAAVKLQPVAVTERAVGLRSYLLRHQHILDAATIVLLAEVAQSGRCSLWLAANRVFRLPGVAKSLGDRVGEHRVYKTLTFAWRLGAFDGLGLVYKQGAGFIPERQGEEPSRERTAASLAEARGKARAQAQHDEEMLAVEQVAYEAELLRLRRAAGVE